MLKELKAAAGGTLLEKGWLGNFFLAAAAKTLLEKGWFRPFFFHICFCLLELLYLQ